jgi:hypothetical protein
MMNSDHGTTYTHTAFRVKGDGHVQVCHGRVVSAARCRMSEVPQQLFRIISYTRGLGIGLLYDAATSYLPRVCLVTKSLSVYPSPPRDAYFSSPQTLPPTPTETLTPKPGT